MVGKTVAIDEKTRNTNDYVRIKLACRDIYQVPASAESSFGMMIYDFYFEREVIAQVHNEALKIGVSTKAPTGQPVLKKMRTEETSNNQINETRCGGGGRIHPCKRGNYKKYEYGQSSAPAKTTWESHKETESKASDEGKYEVSGNEYEESDNYSLGNNGGGLFI